MTYKPTCGIALHRPKTAALFFDFIYGVSEPGMPPNIITFPMKGGKSRTKFSITQDPSNLANNKLHVDMSFDKVKEDIELRLPDLLEHLSGFGLHPVPVYDSEVDLRGNFQTGREAVLTAAIGNIGIVDEALLEWEQVAQIRQDSDSGTALRKLRHWFDAGLAQREQSFVEDEILKRLDAYENALKKHGVLTVVGEFQSLINSPSFAVALGAGLVVPEYWLVPAGIAVANVVIKLAKATVERKFIKHDHAEIAYVHALKKLGHSAGDSTPT